MAEAYHCFVGGTLPKRVALVCLGATSMEWVNYRLSKRIRPGTAGSTGWWDEVWTLNRGIRAFQHDLAFVLDDLRGEAVLDPDYGATLQDHPAPIITSTAYPEFPTARAYPIDEVLDHVGPANYYFRNSVPMILAYANWIGVEELVLFGADYNHPNQRPIEAERANAEYWIGWCRARGMRIGITNGSTLCAANEEASIYGYLTMPDGAMRRYRGW